MDNPLAELGICWIGNPRYSQPLSLTDDKKWRLLSGLGLRIYVIAFANGRLPQRFTQHAHFILLPDLPAALLRYGMIFGFGPLLVLRLILWRNVQVLIAQSPYEGAVGALAKNMARIFGKKVTLIIENHGDFEGVLFKQRQVSFAGVYRGLMNAAAQYAFRHADWLRAVSSGTRQQLETWAGDKPISQFMAWTDSEAFLTTSRTVLLNETEDIIYAGVLTALKGVHVLLDAFATIASEFPNARLRLVGKPQEPPYVAQLHDQVEWLNIQDRVDFVGAVNQHELAAYMGQSRVLVLPSSSEGLPRVVIEAMFAGLIVIGTQLPGILELIQDGVTGHIVPVGEADALAEQLRNALRDANPTEMGERARTFAQNFFSESAYVEGYRQLISSAINHSARPYDDNAGQ